MCVEVTIRLIITILIYLARHWGLTLTFLVATYFLSKIKWLPSILAWIANNIGDLFAEATGFLGVLGTALTSIFLGFMWVAVILNANTYFILKIITLPFAFIAGYIWGVLPTGPLSFAPITLIVEGFTKNETLATITCAVIIVGTIFLPLLISILLGIIGSWLGITEPACSYLNTVIASMA